MSPRTFVARSAAILSLAALGLAACESKTIVTPPTQSLAIVVSPASVTLVAAGQKAQFVALVTGGTTDQVKTYSWTSSNTAVATVDANGVVTAVANGTASIIATTTADATVRAAGLVTVQIPVVVPPVVVPPTISIQSVTRNNGNNVSLDNVFGQINVNLNVDVPAGNNVSKVVVRIGGTDACSQSFSAGSSAQVDVEGTNATIITCSINTALLKADGTPQYPNGATTISALLVGPAGNTLAQTSQSFVLNNDNALNLLVTPGKTAINPNDGNVWAGHGITVKVTPAIFGLNGANITSMTVNVGYASLTKTITSNTAPVTFVFTDSILGSMFGASVEGMTSITAFSTLSTGFSGPSSPGPTIRMLIDEVGPHFSGSGPGANNGFVMNGISAEPYWFGAATAINAKALGFDPASTSRIWDNGVDNNTVKVQYSANTTTRSWQDFTGATGTANDLGEKIAKSLVLRIYACDALDNCAWSSESPAFGIDVKPPVLTGTAPAQINPAAAYSFAVQDTGITGSVVSGTPATNIKFVGKVFTPTKTYCMTDAVGGTAAITSDGCSTISTGLAGFTIPTTPEGYDSVTVFAVDSAGNKSASISKLFLTDVTNPTIGTVQPTVLAIAGGASVTFNTLVQDNIDLNQLTGVLTYGGAVALAMPTQTIDAFGLPMDGGVLLTQAYTLNPFMTSVQTALGGGSTDATTLDVSVSDQANHTVAAPTLTLTPFLTTQASFNFGAAANGGVTANVLATATGNTVLCVSTCGIAPKLKVDTLVYTITVPTGQATPFAGGVTFYRQTAIVGGVSSGPYTPIGTVANGFISETTTQRTISYTLIYTAAKPTDAVAFNFAAIGVDSKGHGLMSNVLPITINP